MKKVLTKLKLFHLNLLGLSSALSRLLQIQLLDTKILSEKFHIASWEQLDLTLYVNLELFTI